MKPKTKKWLGIAGGFIVLMAVFASCGEDEINTPTAEDTSTAEVDAVEETGDDIGGDTGTPVIEEKEEKKEEKAPEKFVEVFKGTAQLTGNSKKFTIKHGNEVKISWKGNGGEMALFSVIMKTADGGHTPVTVMGEMGETKGSQTFYNIQPGEYYLQWNTANFKPTVTVEEK